MNEMNGMKASRPPMGWNSWDSFGTTVTEDEVLANARIMKDSLLEAGWDTVVVDIAWYDPTARAGGYNAGAPLILDDYGRQLPDPARFPSATGGQGFALLAQKIHEMGLQFGIHMMRGIPKLAVERNLPIMGTPWHARDVADMQHVCAWNPDNYGLNQSHPGAQAWYDAQVDQFAAWGVDFLKVDDMQAPFYSDEITAYHRAIEKAEKAHGHSIVLSLSPGTGVSTVHVEYLRGVAQMWRISDDFWDNWAEIQSQFVRLARWAPLQRAGHWADADMLPLGHLNVNAEGEENRQSRLSLDEQRTLLTLWAMGRSPLMVGGDLPSSDASLLSLLQNPALREVTAGSTGNCEIYREPVYGQWGVVSTIRGEAIVWKAEAAEWADGTRSAHPRGVYVAMFWLGEKPEDFSIALQSATGLERREQRWKLTDLWEDGPVTRIEGEGADRVLRATLPAHGVAWCVLDPIDE
ncbi:MAG: glycoside hydrolase family 27 protein [Bifidobacteriaceae bacterium]|jgi:hypothetical protein|nr:glycoside hydrolase family 27 protein [Bifidobacteriaceae bacterium]